MSAGLLQHGEFMNYQGTKVLNYVMNHMPHGASTGWVSASKALSLHRKGFGPATQYELPSTGRVDFDQGKCNHDLIPALPAVQREAHAHAHAHACTRAARSRGCGCGVAPARLRGWCPVVPRAVMRVGGRRC